MTLDWIVGFYEGEGCCTLLRGGAELHRLRVCIVQKEEGVLYKIQDFLRREYNIDGLICPTGDCWQYYIQRQQHAIAFLNLIRDRIQSEKKGTQIDTVFREYVVQRKLSPPKTVGGTKKFVPKVVA